MPPSSRRPSERGGTLSLFEYLTSYWVDVVNGVIEHFDITIAAVAIALVIGVLVGVATYRRPPLASLATTVTAAFLTIPSLALIGIFIGPFGLGTTNVLIALVLYALLPITRNTIVGLNGVDPAVVDAARGVGIGRMRLLWRIKIPLAWPVILTGIRVTTQMVIGIAAIGAYVRGPGLGKLIFGGLARFGAVNSLNQVLIGTIAIVILALLFDLAYVIVGRLTTSRGIRV